MDYPLIWIIPFLVLLLYVVLTFNSLVNWRNQVELAFSVIDVQLKNRYDLVPNLVKTVKAYAEHERTVMEDATAARSLAIKDGASWATQERLQGAVERLIATAEA